MALVVYSDFDGTITLRDSNDALVDRYIGLEKRQAYDRLFLEGHGTLWEILDTSLQACGVPLADAIAFLRATVGIDQSFLPFHRWLAERDIPIEVLSAGLHEVVEAFLQAEGLDLPINANRAHCFPDRFGLLPTDEACPTGVDKAAILLSARDRGLTTVFIGDGFSDRLAAPHADVLYAKSALARYCDQQGIPYVPFDRFAEVQADLERRLPELL